MNSSGYLKDIGWINAFSRGMPIDNINNPIPWTMYSFIDFISNRLNSNMEIIEYGSGNSTQWYAQKVKSVTSVKRDKTWYEKIKKGMPSNVNFIFKELIFDGEYSKVTNVQTKYFYIIVVDGRDRVNCIKNSVRSLKSNGVIVLDDSEREEYIEGVQYLFNNGFKKIDFWRISAGLFYKKKTSIFYKVNNCLEI